MSSCTPEAKRVLDKLMAEKGNDRCIDCGSKLSVDWASVNLGVFFCIDCSGRHRSFGVHISFVRSITMDKWDDRQLAFMKAGGNKACKDFLKEHDCYDLPQAQRWASKGADKWRQKLRARVEAGKSTKKPRKAASSSESESDDDSASSSSDSTSSGEDEAPAVKKPEPKPAKKPAAPLPAKKMPVVDNLIDFDVGGGKSSLDDFFSNAADKKEQAATRVSGAADKKEQASARDKKAEKKSKSKKQGKADKAPPSSESSSEDAGAEEGSRRARKEDKGNKAQKPSRKGQGEAMDNASLDARIQARKDERDQERVRDALAKLEVLCGPVGKGGEAAAWGEVNPPSGGKASVPSDTDTDDSDAERERIEKKRRAQEKERKREAKAAAKAAAAAAAAAGHQGNPSVVRESTMQRMRREAAEEKARKEREKAEYMSQFAGKAAISSSDFFGGDEGASAMSPAQKAARDYSQELDGYKGDNPLAHSILHKGVLAKETLSIAKDRITEVAPDVAGKAGKAAVAAASSAASYLKENASSWLASAAHKVGVSGNSMSSSSGSWIDQEARRRAELSKAAGKDLSKSGGFGDGAKGGLQGFGSENVGSGVGNSEVRSGGFGVIGKTQGGGGLPNSGSGLGLNCADFDKWLDSGDESAEGERKKKKKDKQAKKDKKSKKANKHRDESSGDEADDTAKIKRENIAPSKPVDLIDLLS